MTNKPATAKLIAIIVVLTAATAGLIEVVRLSHARRTLALRLREVEAKLSLPKADEPANS